MNINRYSSYAVVDRVICFNNGERLRGPFPSKCILIEASGNMGLYSRFAAAALATTDAIFHTDDDIGVPQETLDHLYANWFAAPLACHGLFGRAVRPRYEPANVFGPVEVVLTRALMCSRYISNAALAATCHFDDLRGVPPGNGEDIILSFAAMAYSRTPNFAYNLPSENYPVDPRTEIHKAWNGHLKHRQKVVMRCRKVFGISA
jgi:hypothetical protein